MNSIVFDQCDGEEFLPAKIEPKMEPVLLIPESQLLRDPSKKKTMHRTITNDHINVEARRETFKKKTMMRSRSNMEALLGNNTKNAVTNSKSILKPRSSKPVTRRDINNQEEDKKVRFH
jgi:hypothetical protein